MPHPAQLLLNMSMLVLLRLFDGFDGSLEHLRTLAVAKLVWVPWHGTTPPPPSTHSEEPCEAMLSRFAEKLRQFPSTSCKLEGAIDLFLLLALAAGGKKDLQNSRLHQRVVDAIRMHLSMFVRDTDRVPHRAVEWSCAPQVKVVGAWPESMAFPGSLRDPFSTQRLQDFLVKTLHTLAGAVDMNNEGVDVLNSLCPRYTHREIAAARAERDHIFRQNPLPQRYRPRRPPPPAPPAPPGPPVGLVGVPDGEDEVQSEYDGDDCEEMVDQRSIITVSDCDGDVVEEFTCLQEDLSFVLEESDCQQ